MSGKPSRSSNLLVLHAEHNNGTSIPLHSPNKRGHQFAVSKEHAVHGDMSPSTHCEPAILLRMRPCTQVACTGR